MPRRACRDHRGRGPSTRPRTQIQPPRQRNWRGCWRESRVMRRKWSSRGLSWRTQSGCLPSRRLVLMILSSSGWLRSSYETSTCRHGLKSELLPLLKRLPLVMLLLPQRLPLESLLLPQWLSLSILLLLQTLSLTTLLLGAFLVAKLKEGRRRDDEMPPKPGDGRNEDDNLHFKGLKPV